MSCNTIKQSEPEEQKRSTMAEESHTFEDVDVVVVSSHGFTDLPHSPHNPRNRHLYRWEDGRPVERISPGSPPPSLSPAVLPMHWQIARDRLSMPRGWNKNTHRAHKKQAPLAALAPVPTPAVGPIQQEAVRGDRGTISGLPEPEHEPPSRSQRCYAQDASSSRNNASRPQEAPSLAPLTTELKTAGREHDAAAQPRPPSSPVLSGYSTDMSFDTPPDSSPDRSASQSREPAIPGEPRPRPVDGGREDYRIQ